MLVKFKLMLVKCQINTNTKGNRKKSSSLNGWAIKRGGGKARAIKKKKKKIILLQFENKRYFT